MSGFSGKTVLITFGRSFLSLHLARVMGAAGHNVLISDAVHFPITRFSSPVKKTFRTPRSRYEPLEWTQAVAHITHEEGVDVVVPVHPVIADRRGGADSPGHKVCVSAIIAGIHVGGDARASLGGT